MVDGQAGELVGGGWWTGWLIGELAVGGGWWTGRRVGELAGGG